MPKKTTPNITTVIAHRTLFRQAIREFVAREQSLPIHARHLHKSTPPFNCRSDELIKRFEDALREKSLPDVLFDGEYDLSDATRQVCRGMLPSIPLKIENTLIRVLAENASQLAAVMSLEDDIVPHVLTRKYKLERPDEVFFVYLCLLRRTATREPREERVQRYKGFIQGLIQPVVEGMLFHVSESELLRPLLNAEMHRRANRGTMGHALYTRLRERRDGDLKIVESNLSRSIQEKEINSNASLNDASVIVTGTAALDSTPTPASTAPIDVAQGYFDLPLSCKRPADITPALTTSSSVSSSAAWTTGSSVISPGTESDGSLLTPSDESALVSPATFFNGRQLVDSAAGPLKDQISMTLKLPSKKPMKRRRSSLPLACWALSKTRRIEDDPSSGVTEQVAQN